jgi:glucose-6-phosphate-specific signal transduction histidine kinase
MGLRMGFWGRQVAIAIIYGTVYSLLRNVGFAHFVPLAGFKLSVLLLTPPRYWGALLVSETGLLAYGLWDCIAQFGLTFYLFSILPPIGFLMAVVGICRSQLQGLTLPNFRLSSLLICILASSAVLVANGLVSASLIPHPQTFGQKPLLELLPDYFLGVFTGMLAITPLVLTGALEWSEHHSLKAIWKANRPLLQASLVTILAVVAEVALLLLSPNAMVRFIGQAVLFIPAGYFAVKWGWKGASVMGAITSFGIVSLMPGMFDIPTLMAQTMMALFLTTFIVLGLQTTKLKQALEETQNHLKKARLEHQLAEAKLQRSSLELSLTNNELTRLHRHLMIRLDSSYNRSDVEQHKQALNQTTFKISELANALAPPMGASHPHALDEEGPIANLLGKLGIGYQSHIQGQLSLLSKNALSMLYRLACEAVGHLLGQSPTDRVELSTHTENNRDVLTVRLTVKSNGNPIPAPNKQEVMKGLGSFDLGLEELRIRAQLFHGTVSSSDGRLQILLQQELKSTVT